MAIIIFFKTIFFLTIIFSCGFIISKRMYQDRRIQLLIPLSMIVGISSYIFLLNIVSYVLKGPLGIFLALTFEILIAVYLKVKIKTEAIEVPTGIEKKIWMASLLIWFIFIYYISTTGHAYSGDWQNHTTLAALFARGDFPIHSPFQPDRLSSYHAAGAELLGAFKVLIPSPYAFLPSVFSLIFLFVISQIFQWIVKVPKAIFNLLFLVLIPSVAIISFGNFVLAWPYTFHLPNIDLTLLGWLGKLPGLYDAFDGFGSATSLDSLQLFLHRMLALAVFVALLPLVLFPKKSNQRLSAITSIVLIATLALADEAVFIVTAPVVGIATFFILFNKEIKKWLLFSVLALLIIIFQGGLINEMLFNSDQTVTKALFFPSDQTGSTARFEKYRTYRINQQSSKLFEQKEEYYPLRWFHPGALWQLAISFFVSLIFTFTLGRRIKDKSGLYLIWIFFICSLLSLIAFHGIVPKGIYHTNGNRFLALAYQFSGISLILAILLSWIYLKANQRLKPFFILAKCLIFWILLTSIAPHIGHIFPRQNFNWFSLEKISVKPELKWIEDNLRVNNRILAFTEKFPSSGPILEMVREVGIYAPVWLDKPESQGFEVTPVYLDLFFTLNPNLLEQLKVEYLLVSKDYLTGLPESRYKDVQNSKYFQTVYSNNDGTTKIIKILPQFYEQGENYLGTFYDLAKILPNKGEFFIESPPNFDETIWRAAFLTLQMHDYEMYYSTKFIPFYNFIINVDLKHNGESNSSYDYLMLSGKSNPKDFCNCNAELIWSDFRGFIKLWKVG